MRDVVEFAAASARALSGSFWRVVEGQHVVATRRLVDSVDEHVILEDLIETAKPPLPAGAEFRGLHYLLSTPFRYPPLAHGSRFATRNERSILYGAHTLRTAFAETAYYRLLFLEASRATLAPLDADLSSFHAPYRTRKGVDLTRSPFRAHRDRISSPNRYDMPQALGASMRAAGIEAFRYVSARDDRGGVGVGLFTPRACASKRPGALQVWRCIASGDGVEMRRSDLLRPETFVFPRAQFLVRGRLPHPAL